MPSLLRDLHDLLPCDSTGFFWVDSDYEMNNICAEKMLPPDLIRLYFQKYYDSGEQTFKGKFAAQAQSPVAVEIASYSPDFYRSDYYNLIFRHLEAHYVMYAVIRERGKALGRLSIYRTRKDSPFTAAEQGRLAAVTHYIAHGLSTAPARAQDWHATSQDTEQASGLAILDRRGKPVHMSPQGRRLMFLAAYPRICRAALGSADDAILPALAKLCDDLDRVFKGENAPPPVLQVQNAWGTFVFRAYWLGENRDAADALIGVTIQHQEPLPLALLRAMKGTGLSVKQKEVILLLARGDSHQEIARHMNVSLNTANYHVKQIYDKLDAHDRTEVLQKLLVKHS